MSKVGIIGLGRFGSFWAKVLSSGYEVYGYNRSQRPDPSCAVVGFEEICGMPVIFLCVSMRAMRETLERMKPFLKPGTLVIDTCSVKMEPVRWMRELLPERVEILATHPMFGPESAKEGLAGLPLMMHPVRVAGDRYDEWNRFFRSHGIMVVEITPEEHDRQAAMSQALTHMVGRTLSLMGIEETPIGTLWYRKLLAICRQVEKDSPELFLDMQTLNPYAPVMRESFERSWKEVCASLTDGAHRG
jgi:prephenate dehydrogenase